MLPENRTDGRVCVELNRRSSLTKEKKTSVESHNNVICLVRISAKDWKTVFALPVFPITVHPRPLFRCWLVVFRLIHGDVLFRRLRSRRVREPGQVPVRVRIHRRWLQRRVRMQRTQRLPVAGGKEYVSSLFEPWTATLLSILQTWVKSKATRINWSWWRFVRGRRKGGGLVPLEFEIWHFRIKFLAINGCFLGFEWVKSNFTIFVPPGKILGYSWKIRYCPPPPGKNLTRMVRYPWPWGVKAQVGD